MNLDLRHSAVATALVFVLLAAVSDKGLKERPDFPRSAGGMTALRSAASLIIRWPEEPRALAGALLEKYGMPDEMVPSQLSWNDRRPWTKIVVFRDPEAAGRPRHLLESVAYGKITLQRWRALSALGRGASYDPVTQELSARTDGEETNFLSVNLADEVIRGRRSAAAARDFYDETANLSLYGKSSPYMTRLLFEPRRRTLPKLTGAGGT